MSYTFAGFFTRYEAERESDLLVFLSRYEAERELELEADFDFFFCKDLFLNDEIDVFLKRFSAIKDL